MYMCMCAYVLKKEFQQYGEKVSQKYQKWNSSDKESVQSTLRKELES